MKKIIALIGLFLLNNCDSNSECDFEKMNCGQSVYVEDNEKATLFSNNNWTGINGSANVVNYPDLSNKAISFTDGPGNSVAFISSLFPANLTQSGCEIIYKVALNGTTGSDNSIIIYNNTNFYNATIKANFRLNSANSITPNTSFKTITVPLQLASNGLLPSNTYGKWEISPSTNPQEDANRFNQLIQNIGGVAFSLDIPTSTPTWYYDDFSIKTCCPNF